ncbi:hypothetical protein SAMN04487988_101417 [Algoriphagus hitonicola]|uniref:Glycosyl-4,4'-diaponeurosporenoate acyltransferase n=2 Tax=Algoriphagus hitonicola TaxID=435880 RepID=A0A1I2P591_9BACT|nr:hypothetical protein SAMN04487988_101417 [Algoriphagus hitonicola]
MILGFLVNERIKGNQLYHRISRLEFIKNDRINQWIGVGVMKFLVSKTFWGKFNTKLKIEGKPALKEMILLKEEMTSAEISHLIGFLAVLLVSFGLTVTKNYEFGLVLLIINIIFNLYPSLLQQQNKRRITGIIERFYSEIY